MTRRVEKLRLADIREQIETANRESSLPDPDQQNDDRASWAEKAIEAFCVATGSDLEDAVSDLVADLGHFCDRHGFLLRNEINRAADHYDAETDGEGRQFGDVINNPLRDTPAPADLKGEQ